MCVLVEQRDGLFGVIGHEQIKFSFIEDIFLTLKGLDYPQNEIIEVLQSECRGDEISEEGFRQRVERIGHLIFIPQ